MIEYIDGDILDFKCKYIAHQCNCVSLGASGLAKDIFEKYPEANTYQYRSYFCHVPGTIDIIDIIESDISIINLYSQIYPGKENSHNDTEEYRLRYFFNSLKNIYDLDNIAFPYKIGCGLAGGDWSKYLRIIEKFAKNKNVYMVKRGI